MYGLFSEINTYSYYLCEVFLNVSLWFLGATLFVSRPNLFFISHYPGPQSWEKSTHFSSQGVAENWRAFQSTVNNRTDELITPIPLGIEYNGGYSGCFVCTINCRKLVLRCWNVDSNPVCCHFNAWTVFNKI